MRLLVPEDRGVSAKLEVATRASEFVACVKYLAAAGGDRLAAWKVAEAEHAGDRIVTMLKTAATAGSTSNLAALADYRVAVGAFLGSLKGHAVFDTILPDCLRVPLHTRIASVTMAITATGPLGEGSAKPISSLSLASGTLEPVKAAAIVHLTAESVKLGGAEAQNYVAGELRSALAKITDEVFFNLILAGISPTASAGGSVAAVRADFAAALDALVTGSDSKIYFVVAPAVAKRLCMMGGTDGNPAFPNMSPTGGTIGNVPVLCSERLPANTTVALDASQIAAGVEGLTFDVSRHSTIVPDTAPDSPPTASTIPVSLWQNDLIASRLERYFGATRLRAGAVAAISGVNYSGNSPA